MYCKKQSWNGLGRNQIDCQWYGGYLVSLLIILVFLYLKRSGFYLFIFSETEICTFKSTEQCNWKNIQTGDNLDWVKQTGSTPSSQTGPSADHTNPNSIVPIHLLFVISIHEMIGVCVQCSFTCVLLLCMVFLHIVFTKIQ